MGHCPVDRFVRSAVAPVPTKTEQKISSRLTSEDITQDRLDIRSYIDTARKHGINVMAALRQALTGNPWLPPLLAPT